MKRSEMVNIITNILEKNTDGYHDCESIAEFILLEIEKRGMLPPLTFLENFGVFDNSWENEED